MSESNPKTALILLAMGGPEKTSDIKQYLYNIFSDRSIIKLPGGNFLQKPFARLISQLRYKKVQAHYNLIGGGSPLLKWTDAQRENIEFTLAPVMPGFKCYIGMRYFKPTIKFAIENAIEDGFKNLCFLPLYPQYCKATTGSSFEEAEKILKKYDGVEATYISDFHDNNDYISLIKNYINQNIEPGETLLFSAHSIPQEFVDDGDPYVEQTKKSVAMASGDREYFLSFQSRSGPVIWVGPDTVETVKELLQDKTKKLFIVPISFVCDHIETLYEIDIELEQILGDIAKNRIRRMPMFNDDKNFGSILSKLVLEAYNEQRN
jgi:ferrochelatase